MPHALHYILIHIVGLAAKFCVFPVSHYSAVLTEATEKITHSSSAWCAYKDLASSCTLNETQKMLDCRYLTAWRTGHTHTLPAILDDYYDK